MARGSSISIDVLANDRDPDGDLDPTTLGLVVPPTRGRASVVGGRIAYRAGPIGSVTDRFRYRVEDRLGRSATAEVVLTLT